MESTVLLHLQIRKLIRKFADQRPAAARLEFGNLTPSNSIGLFEFSEQPGA